MQIVDTGIPEVKILIPRIFEDDRGSFFESYNRNTMEQIGFNTDFVQDNQSSSTKGVLRGLHYQTGDHAQAKLVRVIQGKVLDVAVDIRKGSPTFGKYESVILDDKENKQFFVPRGFAHGFVVLSETAIFAYKCDNFYNKESEGGIIYNDPNIGIDWQIDANEVLLSEKDVMNPSLKECRNDFTFEK